MQHQSDIYLKNIQNIRQIHKDYCLNLIQHGKEGGAYNG